MYKRPSTIKRTGKKWMPRQRADPLTEWRRRNLGRYLPRPNHVCSPRCVFETLSIGQLIVCTQTGQVHECGFACQQTVVNHTEGDIVCRLTGVVIEQSRPVNGLYGDYQYNDSYVPRDTKELTTENVAMRGRDLAGQRLGRPEATYHGHLAHAIVYISSLLSGDQFTKGRTAHRDQSKLETLLRRYMTHHAMPDLIEMYQIAIKFGQTCKRDVTVRLSFGLIMELSRIYARTAVVAYGLIRQHVPGGKEITGSFKAFVLATLDMCQRGLTVRDQRDRYDIVLIPQDDFLSLSPILPESKRKAAGRLAIPSIKDVQRCIQDAINAGMSPELVRVSCAPLSNLSDEAFQ